MLKRVLWPADDCFCTGLIVMTSSLSFPAVCRLSSGGSASLALRVLRSPLAASRELCCCAAHDGVGREAALCCWREVACGKT